eukprot:scaffold60035_cov71-Phaeocystis_antarctica.AAC.1
MPCALSSDNQPVSSRILLMSAPSAASPCSTRYQLEATGFSRAAGSGAVEWSKVNMLGRASVTSPASRSRTCAAIARGVGCSNTSAGESASPVAAPSRFDSSATANESIPTSISGVLAVTLASASPARSRTVRSTSDSTCGCRCDAGSAASVSASSHDAGLASKAAAGTRCCTLAVNSPSSASLPTRCAGIAKPSCAGRNGSATLTSPQPCSTLPRHAAYSSSPSDHCRSSPSASPLDRQHRGTPRERRGTRWPPRGWPGRSCPRLRLTTKRGQRPERAPKLSPRAGAPRRLPWSGADTPHASPIEAVVAGPLAHEPHAGHPLGELAPQAPPPPPRRNHRTPPPSSSCRRGPAPAATPPGPARRAPPSRSASSAPAAPHHATPAAPRRAAPARPDRPSLATRPQPRRPTPPPPPHRADAVARRGVARPPTSPPTPHHRHRPTMPPPTTARPRPPPRPRRATRRRSARAPTAARGAARAQTPSCR